MTTIVEITVKSNKEIAKLQEKRKRLGYPKEGDTITAIKSGIPEPKFDDEVSLTKGKIYIVIDNLDMLDGYYHVPSDSGYMFVRLTPKVLREYFGIILRLNPSVR